MKQKLQLTMNMKKLGSRLGLNNINMQAGFGSLIMVALFLLNSSCDYEDEQTVTNFTELIVFAKL